MNKPTKYKSLSTTEIKQRVATPVTNTEKTKVLTILAKLTDLIKQKHS